MNMTGMTWDIARDVVSAKMTKADAIEKYGHLIDLDLLNEFIDCIENGCYQQNDDGTVTIRIDAEDGE